MGSPWAARVRQSVEEMVSAGISRTVTRSDGIPSSAAGSSSYPGRVQPTNYASSNSLAASRQVKMSASASAPVMK